MGTMLGAQETVRFKIPLSTFFCSVRRTSSHPKGGKNADSSAQKTQEIVKVTMDDKRIVKCDQRVNLDEDVDEAVTYGDSAIYCKFDGRGKGCYGWVILGGAVFRVSIFSRERSNAGKPIERPIEKAVTIFCT